MMRSKSRFRQRMLPRISTTWRRRYHIRRRGSAKFLRVDRSGLESLDHVHDESLFLLRDVPVGSGDAPQIREHATQGLGVARAAQVVGGSACTIETRLGAGQALVLVDGGAQGR